MSTSALSELRRPTLWAIALAFGAITMMWTTYNEYIPDFLGGVFGVSPLIIALILTLDNTLAFFLEPLIGLVSDRTRTMWGKRLPWLMLALPIGAAAFALIPLPIQALAPDATIIERQQAYSPFVLAVIGMIAAMAITRTPTLALMPDLIAPAHHALAHGLIQMFAGLGTLGALYSGTFLIQQFGVAAPFWASTIVMFASLGWLWFLLHRYDSGNADAGTTSNGYSQWRLVGVVALLWAGYILVGSQLAPALGLDAVEDDFLQRVWIAVFTIAALPSGFVRDGARGMQMGVVLMVAALVLLPFAPALVALLMGVGGAGWALATVNSLPLLINAGPPGRNGRNTGLYYLAFALAGVATPWLVRALSPLAATWTLWLAPAFWLLALVLLAPRPTRAPAVAGA